MYVETNAKDLLGALDSLGVCDEFPVCHKTGEEIKGFKGMWNQKYNQVVSINSAHYTKVQHKEAFAPIVEALAMMNLGELKVRVEEKPTTAVITVLLNKQITPEDGKPIQLGFQMWNSFNRTKAVYLGGFGYRLVCSNGMVAKRTIGAIGIRHLGNKDAIIQSVQKFVYDLDARAEKFMTAINAAMTERIDDKDVELLLNHMGFGKRSNKTILEQFLNEEQTYWGAYNAITSYAQTRKSFWSENRASEKAERILVEPLVMMAEARKVGRIEVV
jgi:hypothetical protein